MLSGRSPFLGHHHYHPQYTTPVKNMKNNYANNDDSVASIIRRIKNGDFRMDSDSWKYVSPAAKSVTRGLLTVDVKKRLTMEALFSSSWINNTLNNNNNPPALLMTPLILNEPKTSMHVIDRNLKQTFNAFHTVARETFMTSGVNHLQLLQQPRSSSVSSSTSSGASSICDSSSLNKAVAEYLQSQQFLIPSPSSLANISEALTGVSYHLLPASTTSVSITKMGPMTRSRKRKMQDPILASPATAVTVIKRERSEATSIFPMASTASAMQYCATARAVVVTPSATWTPTSNNATARSVTITID